MASVLTCESRSRRPVAVVSRPTWPALLRRHRRSSVERADTSDSSVDWWPPGTGPGERGYSARLLPGPGQHDELPGAACAKNIAASCSERHRSADRYLNAGHFRPRQARLSTSPVGRPGPITPPATPAPRDQAPVVGWIIACQNTPHGGCSDTQSRAWVPGRALRSPGGRGTAGRAPPSAGPPPQRRRSGCRAPRSRGERGRTPPCARPRRRRARCPASRPARW